MKLKIYSILTLVLSIPSIYGMNSDSESERPVSSVFTNNKVSYKEFAYEPINTDNKNNKNNKNKKLKNTIKQTKLIIYGDSLPPKPLWDPFTFLQKRASENNAFFRENIEKANQKQNIEKAMEAFDWKILKCKACEISFTGNTNTQNVMQRILRHLNSDTHKKNFNIKGLNLNLKGVQFVRGGEFYEKRGIDWSWSSCQICGQEYASNAGLLKHIYTGKHKINEEHFLPK
jgi:hypothetical protein